MKNEMLIHDMTDEQLIALEESLYDAEVEGVDTWFHAYPVDTCKALC